MIPRITFTDDPDRKPYWAAVVLLALKEKQDGETLFNAVRRTARVSEVEEDAMKKKSAARGKAHTVRKSPQAKARPVKPETVSGGAKTSKPMSGLDAAAKVLAEAKTPLNCREIAERVLSRGLWTTNGKTPAATLSAAIIREIADKAGAARFRKAGPGKYEARSA